MNLNKEDKITKDEAAAIVAVMTASGRQVSEPTVISIVRENYLPKTDDTIETAKTVRLLHAELVGLRLYHIDNYESELADFIKRHSGKACG